LRKFTRRLGERIPFKSRSIWH